MEVFFIRAAQFFVALSIIVIIHELGHFIPAKLFKTRVERFFLFFDVKFALFKKKVGDTLYGIGWLPLGGYVKIAGMVDESMDTKQLEKKPEPWEFRSKPAWQRLIIMLGGVTMNVILAWFIYVFILFIWGQDIMTNENLQNGLAPSELAKKVGFQYGDKVLKVNGEPLEDVWDINKYMLTRNVNTVEVERGGASKVIEIPEDIDKQIFQSDNFVFLNPYFPLIVDSIQENSLGKQMFLEPGDKILSLNKEDVQDKYEFYDKLNSLDKTKPIQVIYKRNEGFFDVSVSRENADKLGISFLGDDIQLTNKKYSFGQSIVGAFSYSYWTLYDYVSQFKFVFTKKGVSQLGGFGTIGKLFPATWNWKEFWHTTALISIILAFMNVLPIPALDGGHVLFTLYEMITGRTPNQKFLEYAQVTGFIILIALFIYANANDIVRIFFS